VKRNPLAKSGILPERSGCLGKSDKNVH